MNADAGQNALVLINLTSTIATCTALVYRGKQGGLLDNLLYQPR